MKTSSKITLVLSIAIIIGWIAYFTLTQQNRSGSTDQNMDLSSYFDSSPSAKPDESKEIADFLRQKAVVGTVISINNCVPIPTVLKVKFDDVVTFVNTGNSNTSLTLGKSGTIDLAKGGSTSVAVSKILPLAKDFKHTATGKVYGCTGTTGPVGAIISSK